MLEAFENNLFTSGVFIDYSKNLWKSILDDIALKARIIYYKSKCGTIIRTGRTEENSFIKVYWIRYGFVV